jgi:hypothetical protein
MCLPALFAVASGLGKSTISVADSELEIKSQLAMLGKEASLSKHNSGPD